MARWVLRSLAVTALALFGGCRVDVDIAVEAGAGGDGLVAVTVRLDRAAVGQIPDLATSFELGDLRAAGWSVAGPSPSPGGGVTIRAEKRFVSVAGAARALAELSGPDGPFGSLRLDRRRTPLGHKTTLSGRIDLTAGAAGFSDPQLQERLGGLPLGVDPAVVERETGQRLDEVFGFRLVAELAGRSATVTARLGQSVPVAVSASRLDARRIALATASAASGLALVVVLARRRWPRGRHSPRT
ncbi:MAG: hypothetical protein ACRD1K_14735 [Acidimicrobiales bacterium]